VVTKLDLENAVKQRIADVMSNVQKAGFESVVLVRGL
jgi:hypothetical protein